MGVAMGTGLGVDVGEVRVERAGRKIAAEWKLKAQGLLVIGII